MSAARCWRSARAEGELEVAVLSATSTSLKAQLKKARQPLDAIREVEEKVGQIEEKVEAPVERRAVGADRPSPAGSLCAWASGSSSAR